MLNKFVTIVAPSLLTAFAIIGSGLLLWQAKEVGERQRLFMLALDTNQNGVIVCDVTGIVYVNDAACEITGWSRSALVGKQSRLIVPEPLVPKHELALASAMHNSQARKHTTYAIVPIKKKDGSVESFRSQIGHVRQNSDTVAVLWIDRVFSGDGDKFKRLDETK